MFTKTILFCLAATTALAAPQYGFGGPIDLSLIPDPGVQRGIPNPASNGADCLGFNGIAIPCRCPPSREELAAKVALFNAQGNAQGTPFNFNTNVADQSRDTQRNRVNALIIALQNFENTSPGVGCPAAAGAPTYVQLQRELAP